MNAPPIASAVPRTPSDLRMALAQFGRELAASLWCAQSGTITAFTPGPPQLADVKLNSAIVVGWNANAGGSPTPVLKQYPTFPQVPVVFPGGAAGSITVPVTPGDSCLLVFLDRDQDNWLTSGQTGLPPNSARLHAPSDAVCFVGLRHAKNAIPNFSQLGAVISTPAIYLNGNVNILTGASDTFISADGATITVVNGVVVNIAR